MSGVFGQELIHQPSATVVGGQERLTAGARVISITWREWAEWTGATVQGVSNLNAHIHRVTIDSRTAGSGDLFVALPGSRVHGHQFVGEAWRAGAVALVENGFADWGGPVLRVASPLDAMGTVVRRYVDDHEVRVVGVTGSVGKTSIKELIAAVLATKYSTAATVSNYNTKIGIPLSFFDASGEVAYFVAEMGMRFAGEIRRLTEITPPDVAVISNIGPSHLETLGSLDAISAAKSEILHGLRPEGAAVLNFDDPRVRYLGNSLKGHRVMWYGETPGLHVSVEQAQLEREHTRIRLRWDQRAWDIRLPWLGVHQAANVAAAFLVGMAAGVAPEQAIEGLETISRNRSRIRRHQVGTLEVLEDDYNASPVSIEAALAVLAAQAGRRVAVLGDVLELGAEEEAMHRRIGIKTASRADVVVTVGSRAQYIAEETAARELPTYSTKTIEEAIAVLTKTLRPGDVVLVKASHGVALERLVRQLEEWGGPR